jgi:hypothetical protein
MLEKKSILSLSVCQRAIGGLKRDLLFETELIWGPNNKAKLQIKEIGPCKGGWMGQKRWSWGWRGSDMDQLRSSRIRQVYL